MNPITAAIHRTRAWFGLRRADRMRANGDLVGALEAYRAVAPSYHGIMRAGILNRAGMVAYNLEDFGRACDFYNEALQHEPEEPRLFMNLGNALDKLGDRKAARAAYERALSKERRGDVLCNVAVFLVDEDPPAALALIRELIAIPPHGDHLPVEAAVRLLPSVGEKPGMVDEVVAFFGELEARTPEGVEPWAVSIGHGVLLSRAGRHQDALAKFAEVIEHWPEVMDVYYHRGMALMRLDRWDEAFHSFRRVDHPVAHYGCALVHEARGERDLAAAEFREYVVPMESMRHDEWSIRGFDLAKESMDHARRFLADHRS